MHTCNFVSANLQPKPEDCLLTGKTVSVHLHTHSTSLSPLCGSSFFFPAVAHSLMDEMKYPVPCGWIPAQVKLSLTGSNALVSVLN